MNILKRTKQLTKLREAQLERLKAIFPHTQVHLGEHYYSASVPWYTRFLYKIRSLIKRIYNWLNDLCDCGGQLIPYDDKKDTCYECGAVYKFGKRI